MKFLKIPNTELFQFSIRTPFNVFTTLQQPTKAQSCLGLIIICFQLNSEVVRMNKILGVQRSSLFPQLASTVPQMRSYANEKINII